MASCRGSLAKFVLAVVNLLLISLALCTVFVGYKIRITLQAAADSAGHDVTAITNATSLSSNLDVTTPSADTMSRFYCNLGLVLVLGGALFVVIGLLGLFATLCESLSLLNLYVYFVGTLMFFVVAFNVLAWLYAVEALAKAHSAWNQLVADSAHPRNQTERNSPLPSENRVQVANFALIPFVLFHSVCR